MILWKIIRNLLFNFKATSMTFVVPDHVESTVNVNGEEITVRGPCSYTLKSYLPFEIEFSRDSIVERTEIK